MDYDRNSGIEILKIFAMIIIVISHVAQSFGGNHSSVLVYYHIAPINDYFTNLNIATANIQILIIALLRHLGALGNDIFFISSAWFLVDSRVVKGKKIIQMLTDVWIISVAILLVFYLLHFPVTAKQAIKSLLPTTFGPKLQVQLERHIAYYAFWKLITPKYVLFSSACDLDFTWSSQCDSLSWL